MGRVARAAAEAGPAGAECGARLAAALARFWVARGHLREGRGWLGEALARPGAGDGALGAKTSCAAGFVAWSGGDARGARPLLEAALRGYRALGDAAGTAEALRHLGMVHVQLDALDRARPLLERALARYRRLGDRWGAAQALEHLAQADARAGDHGAARRRLEEALALVRGAGGRPRRGLDPALPGQAGPPGRGPPDRQGAPRAEPGDLRRPRGDPRHGAGAARPRGRRRRGQAAGAGPGPRRRRGGPGRARRAGARPGRPTRTTSAGSTVPARLSGPAPGRRRGRGAPRCGRSRPSPTPSAATGGRRARTAATHRGRPLGAPARPGGLVAGIAPPA